MKGIFPASLTGAIACCALLFTTAHAYVLRIEPGSAGQPRVIANEAALNPADYATYEVGLYFLNTTALDEKFTITLSVQGAKLFQAVMGSDVTSCAGPNMFAAEVLEGGEKDGNSVVLTAENVNICETVSGSANVSSVKLSVTLTGVADGVPVFLASNVSDSNGQPYESGVPVNGDIQLVGYAQGFDVEVDAADEILASGEAEPIYSELTGPSPDTASLGSITFKRIATAPAIDTNTDVSGGVENGDRQVPIYLSLTGPETTLDTSILNINFTLKGNFSSFGVVENEDGSSFNRTVYYQPESSPALRNNFAIAEGNSETQTVVIPAALNDTYEFGISQDDGYPDSFSRSRFLMDLAYDVGGPAQLQFRRVSFSNLALAPLRREGEMLVFPWLASQTKAAESGSIVLLRLSNAGERDTGTVLARALSSDREDYVTPSEYVEVASKIGKNSEVVVASSQLENLLGDFGRGDVEFIVENPGTRLATRKVIISIENSIFTFDRVGSADRYED